MFSSLVTAYICKLNYRHIILYNWETIFVFVCDNSITVDCWRHGRHGDGVCCCCGLESEGAASLRRSGTLHLVEFRAVPRMF